MVGQRGSGLSKKWTGKFEVMPPSENHSSWRIERVEQDQRFAVVLHGAA